MIKEFPLLQQPSGSKSCLSTSVRAILLWHGESVTQSEVSAWCGENERGCWLDSAIEELRLEGFDIDDLTRSEENEIIAIAADEDDPQPVLVTIQNSIAGLMDHAVVLLGIETGAEGGETVFYFDPLTGAIEQDATGEFWINWQYAGERAFILHP